VQCAISFDTDIDSTKVKQGDIVMATLKQSLLVNPVYNAPPGSKIIGHITGKAKKRTLVKAILSKDRRFSQDDAVDITFTDLYCPDKKHFYVEGRLTKQKISIPLPNGHLQAISANKQGELVHDHEVLKLKVKIANWVGQYALQAATVTSGIFTVGIGFFAVPCVMGVAGAISPSFVTNSPTDPDDPHAHAKGFGWGFVNALPGSTIVEAFICKGDDTEVASGLTMVVDFRPAEAALVAARSVKGVVCNQQVAASQPIAVH
jgi:hypothetical protein